MIETNQQIAVRLTDVEKIYQMGPSGVPALKGISLSLKRGETVALTGPSGSGKSTLLQLIGALDRPTSGSVEVAGADISQLGDNQASKFRNRMVGFVFQMNNLLPEFSSIENVMMPGLIAGNSRFEIEKKATYLLDAVGLADRKLHRPAELSGGEQQRVAIARALLMNPPLILADEPTGNLDTKSSTVVQDLLFNLCKEMNTTMILVTHDLKLAKRLPKCLHLEDGRIVN